MKTEKMNISEKKETISALKNVEVGKIVRFEHISFEDAIKEDLFYVVASQSKEKRVKLFCIANAEIIERDDDWRVITHDYKLMVKQNIF